MANNGRWHGLNVQFDLISINQLAVRKLSKQARLRTSEGGELSILLAAFCGIRKRCCCATNV